MMEVIRDYWMVIWALVLTSFNAIQLLLAKTYARREELETVNMAVEQLKTKVAELPDSRETHQLRLEITELRGEMHALREQLKPVNHLANLLLEERLNVRR